MKRTTTKTKKLCTKNLMIVDKKTLKECIKNMGSRGILKGRAKILCRTNKSDIAKFCSRRGLYSKEDIKILFRSTFGSGEKQTKNFQVMMWQLNMIEVVPQIYRNMNDFGK